MSDTRPWMIRVNGVYNVYGKTYNMREVLKQFGGRWNAEARCWSLPANKETLDELRLLQVVLRVKVGRSAFCHEPAAEVYVDSADADRGWTEHNFCGNCDSHHRDPVRVVRID